MHPTENVGGEKGCVIGKGDVLVRTKRRYSLQWEKTFKVTYLVINHSLKSTNFLEEKRKTVTQPHTHTTRDQAKQHPLSQHMSKRSNREIDVPEVSLTDQGQGKVHARCQHFNLNQS